MTADPILPWALLLDLDDTLLNFGGGADRCWQIVCDRAAIERYKITASQLLATIDAYRLWFWSDPDRHRSGRLNLAQARTRIVSGALEQLGIDAPELARQIAQDYTQAREESLCLFPDTLPTLTHLRSSGVKLALITNGQAQLQRRKIERFGLADYFSVILVEGEFGLGKPDERVYLHVLDQLGIDPAEAWMVGDNLEWEVAAPQRLGMKGIWYDVEGKGLPPTTIVRPDRIIRRLSDLLI